MPPATLRPAAVLAVVTLVIWTTRIRNIWSDEELSTAGQLGRTALALAFTAFGVAVLGLWWRSLRRGAAPAAARTLVRAFAAWTTAVWIVRAVQIATADHEVGFVVVHTVLAVGSIALAAWADRRAPGPVGRPAHRARFHGP